ncbi:hypothetical protein FGG08_002449 [Glutinoglossum americanum]|uniref:Uncharacterized protein n=1 Tax=Glutinoglossum americanum TaxID=1670608 RepID=A0A9P8I676_9PEZI|nr:hypothetical protein FGG08_002449 [Glutinoglossum americanum]
MLLAVADAEGAEEAEGADEAHQTGDAERAVALLLEGGEQDVVEGAADVVADAKEDLDQGLVVAHGEGDGAGGGQGPVGAVGGGGEGGAGEGAELVFVEAAGWGVVEDEVGGG